MSNKYLEYFYSRGVGDKTIKDFELGFCTENGSCSHPEYPPFIDYRFKDSVLFPIKDLYNNLIAVGSRSIVEKNYIHSSFTKKKHLYGLNVTYKEILKNKRVWVVEGNFDMLSLYESGIKNVVAMMGSNLSLEQIGLLSRFAEEIIIAADSDKAGRECAEASIEVLMENGIDCKRVNLPEGIDPDKFVRDYGKEAFLKLLPVSLIERVERL